MGYPRGGIYRSSTCPRCHASVSPRRPLGRGVEEYAHGETQRNPEPQWDHASLDGSDARPSLFQSVAQDLEPHVAVKGAAVHEVQDRQEPQSELLDTEPGMESSGVALEAEDIFPADDAVFEGTVRLAVEAENCVRPVLNFVEELSKKPQLRLLQLVGNQRRAGLDIWIGLREPLCLKDVLHGMDGVASVNTPLGYSPKGHERLLEVRLA